MSESATDQPPAQQPRRATLLIYGAAGALIIAIQLATNGKIGFHIDELYYLASGRHPAFGYVDFPAHRSPPRPARDRPAGGRAVDPAAPPRTPQRRQRSSLGRLCAQARRLPEASSTRPPRRGHRTAHRRHLAL